MKAWETHFDERQRKEMAELLAMGVVPYKVSELKTWPMQPKRPTLDARKYCKDYGQLQRIGTLPED